MHSYVDVDSDNRINIPINANLRGLFLDCCSIFFLYCTVTSPKPPKINIYLNKHLQNMLCNISSKKNEQEYHLCHCDIQSKSRIHLLNSYKSFGMLFHNSWMDIVRCSFVHSILLYILKVIDTVEQILYIESRTLLKIELLCSNL